MNASLRSIRSAVAAVIAVLLVAHPSGAKTTTFTLKAQWSNGSATGSDDLAVSPDGRSLVASHPTGGVRSWNLSTRKLRWSQTPLALTEPLGGVRNRLAFAPDGRWLYVADQPSVQLLNPTTGVANPEPLCRVTPTTAGFFNSALVVASPVLGDVVCRSSYLELVVKRHGPDGCCAEQVGPTIEFALAQAAVVTNGGVLIAAEFRGAETPPGLKAWNLADGKELWRTYTLGVYPRELALAPKPIDGKLLVYGAYSGRVVATDTTSGGEFATSGSDLPQKPSATAIAIAVSPTTGRVAALNLNGSVTIWEPGLSRVVKTFQAHEVGSSMSFSVDGTTLITSGTDGAAGTIKLWKVG